jgi:L-2,4-diaminobutyrate decarboxylase
MCIENLRRSFSNPFEVPANADITRRLLEGIFRPSTPFTQPPQTDLSLDDLETGDVASVLSQVEELIVKYAVNVRHPESVAHMVPPPASISVIADLIIGAMNQCAFIWEEAPSGFKLETEVLRWLNRQVGYERSAGGLLTSGGTMSNITAVYLALARARSQGVAPESACIIASDQAHFSIEKGALLTGLGPTSVLRVETDFEGRVRRGSLSHEVLRAKRAGRHPVMLVCTAGTTNAGTLEPVDEALTIAEEEDVWCHIDAAHGGAMCLVEDADGMVNRWRLADSISWDAHKTLYASYAVGSLLVRDENFLEPLTFHAEYALKVDSHEDPGRKHIDGSRRLEALKVWMLIKHLGKAGLAELTRHGCMLAHRFANHIQSSPSFRLLTHPDSNIVCFRLECDARTDLDVDEMNRTLQRILFLTGGPLLSTTTFRKRIFLRSVFLNPHTSAIDVDGLFDTLRITSDEVLARRTAPLELSNESVLS